MDDRKGMRSRCVDLAACKIDGTWMLALQRRILETFDLSIVGQEIQPNVAIESFEMFDGEDLC
jgi:hypothetical protein